MKRLFAISLLALASCQTYVVEFENGTPTAEPAHKQAQVSMWLGIKEWTAPLEVSCPRGPARVVIRRSPVDFLIHWGIGGVYTRYTAEGYCANP